MAKVQTLSLGEYWSEFIDKKLEKGRYNSASEVVRDALRLLEEHDAESALQELNCVLPDSEEDNGGLSVKDVFD